MWVLKKNKKIIFVYILMLCQAVYSMDKKLGLSASSLSSSSSSSFSSSSLSSSAKKTRFSVQNHFDQLDDNTSITTVLPDNRESENDYDQLSTCSYKTLRLASGNNKKQDVSAGLSDDENDNESSQSLVSKEDEFINKLKNEMARVISMELLARNSFDKLKGVINKYIRNYGYISKDKIESLRNYIYFMGRGSKKSEAKMRYRRKKLMEFICNLQEPNNLTSSNSVSQVQTTHKTQQTFAAPAPMRPKRKVKKLKPKIDVPLDLSEYPYLNRAINGSMEDDERVPDLLLDRNQQASSIASVPSSAQQPVILFSIFDYLKRNPSDVISLNDYNALSKARNDKLQKDTKFQRSATVFDVMVELSIYPVSDSSAKSATVQPVHEPKPLMLTLPDLQVPLTKEQEDYLWSSCPLSSATAQSRSASASSANQQSLVDLDLS